MRSISLVIICLFFTTGCFTRIVPIKGISPVINVPDKPSIKIPQFPTDANGEPILTDNEKMLIDALTIVINDNEKLRESIRIYNESAIKNNDEIYQTLQIEKAKQKWLITPFTK